MTFCSWIVQSLRHIWCAILHIINLRMSLKSIVDTICEWQVASLSIHSSSFSHDSLVMEPSMISVTFLARSITLIWNFRSPKLSHVNFSMLESWINCSGCWVWIGFRTRLLTIEFSCWSPTSLPLELGVCVVPVQESPSPWYLTKMEKRGSWCASIS